VNIRQTLRGILMSVVLAAGLLALMQVEQPYDEQEAAWRKPVTQRNTWRKLYDAAAVVAGAKPSADRAALDLRELMDGDELAGINPFENLNSEDTLNRVFSRGIQAFERQTLRSPSYREESGYDLVHYEILHKDGSMSSILAFLEQPEDSASAFDVRTETAMVMVLTPKDGQQEYALYRDGALEELNMLMREEGSALFAQRLEAGIPFLSVSR